MASLPEHSLSERDGSSNRGRHFRLSLRSPFQQVFQGRSKKGPANLALTDFDHSVKLGIAAGTRGKVGLSLTIQYKGSEKPPRWSKLPQGSVTIAANLPFRCTPEGDFTFERKTGTNSAQFPDRAVGGNRGLSPTGKSLGHQLTGRSGIGVEAMDATTPDA